MFAENFRAASETQAIHGHADGYQPFDHGDLQKTELVKQRLFFEDLQKQSRNVSFGVQKQLSAMKGSFPPESAPETTGRENRAERIETRCAVLCRFVKHMRQGLEKIISVTDREIRSLLCMGRRVPF